MRFKSEPSFTIAKLVECYHGFNINDVPQRSHNSDSWKVFLTRLKLPCNCCILIWFDKCLALFNKNLCQLAESNPSVNIYKLDTTDFDSLPSLENKVGELVGDTGLDVIINNAGAYLKMSLLEGSPNEMIDNFKINSVAPVMITRCLLPHLRKATFRNSPHRPTVVNITSKMGSIDDNTSGGSYAYRTSKAALNMVTKSMSVDLEKSGINAVAIHPGWVKTAMGGPNAFIDTVESVTNMIRVIGDVQTGKNRSLFVNYDGREIKW